MQALIIEVNGQSFKTGLYNNETAKALLERLPMTLNMDELNGNEKFYYLDDRLPADSENVGSIQTGDIMLFGSDCLVLFFEDFSTSYSYTRIGHIDDSQGFADALADGTVEVTTPPLPPYPKTASETALHAWLPQRHLIWPESRRLQ